MEDVKSVLHSVMADLAKKQKGTSLQKAEGLWKKAVGPKASGHTKIVRLTKDKIHVNVDTSAWLYELNLKKGRIQRQLGKSLKIKEVRMRLGSIH